ncbi:unnamed protein product [Closterium sp. Yama58-4]|nr:unnamed protein product [Closterium sp. Yama58-4]
MPGEKRNGWSDVEVMQLAWTRHDIDEDVRAQTRLQGQNRDVTVWLELKRRHPNFRHKFSAPSRKGRPPEILFYYNIYDRIFGDCANAVPPALAGRLPGANVIRTPPATLAITEPGPGTEAFGAGSQPVASAAPSSPSPVPELMSQPSSLPTTPSRHTSPTAAGASPPLSRRAGARAGLSLRGNRVVRWPRARGHMGVCP